MRARGLDAIAVRRDWPAEANQVEWYYGSDGTAPCFLSRRGHRRRSPKRSTPTIRMLRAAVDQQLDHVLELNRRLDAARACASHQRDDVEVVADARRELQRGQEHLRRLVEWLDCVTRPADVAVRVAVPILLAPRPGRA